MFIKERKRKEQRKKYKKKGKEEKIKNGKKKEMEKKNKFIGTNNVWTMYRVVVKSKKKGKW